MNNQFNYDRIIEKENIGDATLALLTNQDSLSARDAGIFTLDDLINIHRHVQFALTLPMKESDILKWFGINDENDELLPATELADVIINIRSHANTWDNVEKQVKEQSVDLSLTSRNIIQTGDQIVEYINHMPIIQKISESLDNLSEHELKQITYQNDDQQIATELLSILQLIKGDIKQQSVKTIRIKNTVSDFRAHITGGYLSDYSHVESLLFNIKGLYQQLESKNDPETSESFLKELIEFKKNELIQLEQEYSHYVKLCFTGLAGGIIGLLITSSIFGSKAEAIRHRKNLIIKEIEETNAKINQEKLLQKTIFDIQINLQKIEGLFKDARLAIDHLDYMWLVILTEVKQSIDIFSKINNAEKLLRFITQFKRIITSWSSIQDYSVHLIKLFDELQINDKISQ
ncbi:MULTISPECIES: alpha-xenorhabdolysin family binary toxin subunit A [Providencia]|uniref:alpha-xenorhabdolysin family binary toxin subunit A n=1 Tax=Providencia TaxID=586 RepID=UPI0012B5C3C1|nr:MULTISPECIES: alpha-xenorhabdolysin family binary toxin subunit A [Providencia]MTC57849.1 alpha-xenorhabdolysin family binary toxin subunit A [Providencia rustigianii]